jgi:hypothetical protein
MAQGKEWNKEKIIYEVLKPLFKLGYSVRKACIYAGIPNTTVDTWLKDDAELRLEINVWQNEVSIKARKNITARVLGKDAPNDMKDEKADVAMSHVWLRAREKEDWAERSEVVQANVSYEELKAMQEENQKEAEEIKASRKTKKGLYDTVSKNPRA